VTILDEILERKAEEVASLRREPGQAALRDAASAAVAPRGFARALAAGPGPRVIAEFKRASPSKGEIRPGAEPARIARAYADAGAAALSVLTDQAFFGGSLEDLRAARAAVELPVLRKDFTIDPLQVLEARAAGADAVLLIVAALEDAQLRDLQGLAREIGLDVLVEVHDRAELERAQRMGASLIGVNNRDLRTFQTDVKVTRELCAAAQDCTLVSESGLDRFEVLRDLESLGVDAFLVGEALMRDPDPGAALRRLRGEE
jgi:indole-3-glycerol phosphate synthase